MELYIIASVLFIMLASLAGIIFISQSLSHFLVHNLKILIAFSGGVFLVLAYSLFKESVEIGVSLELLLTSALLGAGFLEAVSWLTPQTHHHHSTDHDHLHNRKEAHRMLSGDAVHNIADGIVLVPAFLIDVWVGVGTAVAIFLHEFVQEIAEFFVLKEAGYTTRQALIRNFAVSATILIGVLLAFFAVSIETLEAPLLAFAGGGFTYVILRDLLPSIIRSVQSGHRVAYFILAAVIGAGLLSSIQAITPHGHEHKEGRSGVETERHYD